MQKDKNYTQHPLVFIAIFIALLGCSFVPAQSQAIEKNTGNSTDVLANKKTGMLSVLESLENDTDYAQYDNWRDSPYCYSNVNVDFDNFRDFNFNFDNIDFSKLEDRIQKMVDKYSSYEFDSFDNANIDKRFEDLEKRLEEMTDHLDVQIEQVMKKIDQKVKSKHDKVI